MKKLLVLTVVASIAIFVLSCSKNGSQITGGSPATGDNNGSGDSPTGGQTKPSFVSEWFTVEFHTADDPLVNGLFGEVALSPDIPASFTADVKLVYARHAGREIIYDKLPITVEFKDDQVNLAANFTNGSVVLVITNSNGKNNLSDAGIFDGYEYRYLSVPVTLYQTLNIDWTNYEEVASALKFQL